MKEMIVQFRQASRETKWFIFNCVIYGFLLIATTLFCYFRLDYVRSYKEAPAAQESSKN